MLKQVNRIVFFIVLIAGICGCASIPYDYPPKIEGIPGKYHRVEKGETLWRISKNYNTELEELVRINRISDKGQIEIGQLIFIPETNFPQVSSSSSLYSVNNEDFNWPVKGKVILAFGQAHNDVINKGIDIEAGYGSNVIASRSGVISFYNPRLKGMGKTIIIDHGDDFLSVYSRNSQILVKVGDSVKQGDIIAKVGNSGRDKMNYLHFEIRKGHTPQNPYYYLP